VEGIHAGFPASFREATRVRTTGSPVVTVRQPATHAISWDAGGQIGHFKVQLSRDGHTWTMLFATVAGTERQVHVSVDPPASENARIRVEAVGPTGSGSDDSGPFRIRARQ
jgi:hypothetical protein